jgi:hypothetical protein
MIHGLDEMLQQEENAADTDAQRRIAPVVMRPITCDQVAWLLDIAERHIPNDNRVRVSRQREMQKYAMLYEIMEVASLQFADDRARWNGTPNDAQPIET